VRERKVIVRDANVLVIGASDACNAVVSSLRSRGINAWSDRIGRAAADFISMDWADALVVIDSSEHVESQHLLPLVGFRNASILAASAPLDSDGLARLLERGFDAVLSWPCSTELVAAMVARMLRLPSAEHGGRRHARLG
jgi:hypothetical protein